MHANGFFRVANDTVKDGLIADIGVHAFAVYCVLLSHSQGPGTSCHPSHKTIAKMTGMSVKTSQRSIQRLETAGLIAVKTRSGSYRNTTNLYTLSSSDSQSPLNGLVATDSRPSSDSQSPPVATDSRTKKNKEEEQLRTPVANQLPLASFSFETWWLTYPMRGGRRREKPKAKSAFAKIPNARIEDLKRATANYAGECNGKPKDPHRWLAGPWEDYVGAPSESHQLAASTSTPPPPISTTSNPRRRAS